MEDLSKDDIQGNLGINTNSIKVITELKSIEKEKEKERIEYLEKKVESLQRTISWIYNSLEDLRRTPVYDEDISAILYNFETKDK